MPEHKGFTNAGQFGDLFGPGSAKALLRKDFQGSIDNLRPSLLPAEALSFLGGRDRGEGAISNLCRSYSPSPNRDLIFDLLSKGR